MQKYVYAVEIHIPLQHRVRIAILAFLFFAAVCRAGIIQNDTFWRDDSGNLICSQGGGVLKVGKIYYWYGVNYAGATTYAANPTPANTTRAIFKSVTCYSSTDLAHWKFEGDALSQNQTGGGWFGRMGVVFNAQTGKYVMLAQGSGPDHGGGEYFATSTSPTGPFIFDHAQHPIPGIDNGGTGDQTVFQDDDGKAYLICSNSHGRNDLYVAPLRASDFLAVESAKEIGRGPGREGNCLFKYNGRYYFCSSNLHGWNASPTYVISASNILGPYGAEQVMKNTELDFSHVTQTGFFITVNGSKQSTVIFCGDRWSDFGGNGIGYNQWCPISFDGQTPVFHSLSQWDIDAATGEWKIGPKNNYVLNPSFDADRVAQNALAGWVNTYDPPGEDPDSNLKGDPHSGKFCMQQKAATDYRATMSQTITGLPNGSYTLSAWVRSSGGQHSALIAARDFGGTDLSVSIAKPIAGWTQVTLPDVQVTNGQCQVAIVSDARANQWVQLDDVSLVSNSPATVAEEPAATPAATGPAAPTPAASSPPPPAPDQHFATVADAQKEALRRYPDLGVAGSRFNAGFVALYARYKQERPALFQDPSWPLQIAETVAAYQKTAAVSTVNPAEGP
jgi:hypothetical protein